MTSPRDYVTQPFFIIMDYLIHNDTISMELSILYIKGLLVKISRR